MDIRELEAKSILSPCGIPGIDYVINPYVGCSFACTYCYASFMGRFVGGKTIADWGNYVYAKVNAPMLLKKELETKLKNKGIGKEILISSVTDPYQGMEAKYKITRKCLEVLADFGYEGILGMLTKSKLITRDIDILKRFKYVTVGLTITSTRDSISRYFEKFAPPVSLRIEALDLLNKNGIHTYAFIGPLLPHYVAKVEELENIFKKLSEVGTKDIFVEHINLSSYIKKRLLSSMEGLNKRVIEEFYSSQSKDYRVKLDELVKDLVKKYKMNLLTDMVIYHKEFQKKPSVLRPHTFS